MIETMNKLREYVDADLKLDLTEGFAAGQRGQTIGVWAQRLVLGSLPMMALVCLGIGWMLVRGISAPIGTTTNTLRRLADRDLAVAIPFTERGDEIGGMATAVQIFKDNMVAANAATVAQEAERIAKEPRAERLSAMVGGFEAKIGALVAVLSASSTEMEATAQSMSATAAQTNQQATTVTAAAEEASAGIQTVAAAAEELTASISEISRQVA